jgi:ABC-2 type transport system permease protein
MFGRIWQMLIKEMIQLRRDKYARIRLLVPPLVQLIVFGYAATFEVYHVSTAVLDYDHSQESRELISRFTGNGRFQLSELPASRNDIRDLIDRSRVSVAIQIDPQFAENLRKGQTAPVQVIVDGTNSNTALIALGYIGEIAMRFAADYQNDRLSRIAPRYLEQLPSVQMVERPWYNPDLNSKWFFVPGIIGSLTLLTIVNLTAFAVVREREIGTLEQIMVTPMRPIELILGKTLPFFIIGLVQVLLIALVGILWFGIPFRGNPLVMLLGTSLFLISTLAVGLLISTMCSTQQQAFASSFFFLTPAFTLSGFAFPIASMPPAMRWFTYINPLRYYLVVLRGTFLKGTGLAILWPQMLAMTLLAVALLTISILRFRKSLD